jgi:large subunit ribosomal protein L34
LLQLYPIPAWGVNFILTDAPRSIKIVFPKRAEAMKPTFKPNVRKRKNGRVRMKTKGGQKVIKSRRQKGRQRIAV